jgi:hypothetical protein
MKRLLTFLLLLFCIGSLSAQKTYDAANPQKRNVPSFHGVEVSTGIKLILTEGSSEEVAVSASTDEDRDKIITKVENGILKIYFDNKKILSVNSKKEKHDLKAWVSYKMLDQLDANTGAVATIEGTLHSANLKMKVNTGAIVNGKVEISDLDVHQDTGSIITITGTVGKIDVDGTTGSIFKGKDLNSSSCNASVTTGAQVFISVEKELNVKANTGGIVKYSGEGTIRDIKTNTGGSVSHI